MSRCKKCGFAVPSHTSACWMCGAPLAETVSAVYTTPSDMRRHVLANTICALFFALPGWFLSEYIRGALALAARCSMWDEVEFVRLFMVSIAFLAVWGFICGLVSTRDYRATQIFIGWWLPPLVLCAWFWYPGPLLLAALPLCAALGTLSGVRLRRAIFFAKLAWPVFIFLVLAATWHGTYALTYFLHK